MRSRNQDLQRANFPPRDRDLSVEGERHFYDMSRIAKQVFGAKHRDPRLLQTRAELLEHIPIRSNRSDRQEYAQAFDSGPISDRPNEAIRSESALVMLNNSHKCP
jgi:hypothetical protein